MKHTVICDTNIWYGLADGTIDPIVATQNKLISTYLSLLELMSSENLIDDPMIVQSALVAMRDYSYGLIKAPPIFFIFRACHPNFIVDNSFTDFLLDQANLIIQSNSQQLMQIGQNQNLRSQIEEFDNVLDESVNFANDVTPILRQQIVNGKGKKFHRRIDSTGEIKKLLIHLLDKAIESEQLQLTMNYEEFPWERFELLINVWDLFFKDLEVSGKTKMERNDWADILNLTYVGKDSMYWTREKKWNVIMKSNNSIQKYMFTQI